jgi:hypothetical protein
MSRCKCECQAQEDQEASSIGSDCPYTEASSFDPGSSYFTSSALKDLALSAVVLIGIILIGMAIVAGNDNEERDIQGTPLQVR